MALFLLQPSLWGMQSAISDGLHQQLAVARVQKVHPVATLARSSFEAEKEKTLRTVAKVEVGERV